jgi:DNA-binding NtrC family response regulator
VVSVRVLVVEQTDALREAYSDALSTAGMDVFTAKTVPEAAALFAEHGASIVVLDLLLVRVMRLHLWPDYWVRALKPGSLRQQRAEPCVKRALPLIWVRLIML